MQKKGQFTIEFMLIFLMALMIFLIVLAYITLYVEENKNNYDLAAYQNFAQSIKKNIMLAYDSPEGFEIELFLPKTIDEIPINITIDNNLLYIINKQTKESININLPETNGNFKTGECNKIIKKQGEIKIENC